jgi:hypothetical protein
MITIEHDFKKPKLTPEERELSKNMKKFASYKNKSMTQWFIDQLAALLVERERNSKQ